MLFIKHHYTCSLLYTFIGETCRTINATLSTKTIKPLQSGLKNFTTVNGKACLNASLNNGNKTQSLRSLSNQKNILHGGVGKDNILV